MVAGIIPSEWNSSVLSPSRLLLIIFMVGCLCGYFYALWERQYYFWDRCLEWARLLVYGTMMQQSATHVPVASLSAVVGALLSRRVLAISGA